jgi:hypothetical protein
MPAFSHAIGMGIEKIEEYVNKTRSPPTHILVMALNPSIQYTWIEQHWSPKDAAKAKEVVEVHVSFPCMIQCIPDFVSF